MATTEELYKTTTGTTGTAATTPAASQTSASGNPDVSTNMAGIAKTNQQREDAINKMYDASLESRNASLKSAYDINLGNAQADKEKIGEQYQTQRNSASAEYERQRRNNNMAFAANGLNTGASSQAQLAQSNAYQTNIGQLGKAEAAANTEADRNISNIQGAYQADIAQAKADNDTQRMAALLDEWSNAYSRISDSAKLLAASGDFSGYEMLYGAEQAANMKKAWIAENPDTAYRTGAINADEYFRMTGKYPPGYRAPSSGGGGGGGGGYYGGNSPSAKDVYAINASDLSAVANSGAYSSGEINNWIGSASNGSSSSKGTSLSFKPGSGNVTTSSNGTKTYSSSTSSKAATNAINSVLASLKK